jgi:hypothetical protein
MHEVHPWLPSLSTAPSAIRARDRSDTVDRPFAGVRTLTPAGLPLLVADLPATHAGALVHAALLGAGLMVLPGLFGVDFPRGARVGVQLEGEEVRLVDESDTTLLRLARSGLGPVWLERAVRMRGTMLVVITAAGMTESTDERALGDALELLARDGGAIGAIVGVHDRRPRLPLLF